MINLKGKVAVVTGASRGIGRACAIELAKNGASVVVNYFKSKNFADSAADIIKDLKREARVFRADVSESRECKRLIDYTISEFGKIDILVNNAGIHIEQDISKIDDFDWSKILNTNAKSVYIMSSIAGNIMKSSGGGSIINIGSLASQFPRAQNIIYSASKGAVWTLTRGLAIALAPEVRVNSIAPGRIETDMSPMDDPEKREMVISSNLRNRIGQTEDIAKIVVFLADKSSDWITGQTIIADGGSSLI